VLVNSRHILQIQHVLEEGWNANGRSSWLPLYDHATLVPNILWAQPQDYKKATQRIYHTPPHPASSSFRESPCTDFQMSDQKKRALMARPHFRFEDG
jgi:hypothetical protein